MRPYLQQASHALQHCEAPLRCVLAGFPGVHRDVGGVGSGQLAHGYAIRRRGQASLAIPVIHRGQVAAKYAEACLQWVQVKVLQGCDVLLMPCLGRQVDRSTCQRKYKAIKREPCLLEVLGCHLKHAEVHVGGRVEAATADKHGLWTPGGRARLPLALQLV